MQLTEKIGTPGTSSYMAIPTEEGWLCTRQNKYRGLIKAFSGKFRGVLPEVTSRNGLKIEDLNVAAVLFYGAKDNIGSRLMPLSEAWEKDHLTRRRGFLESFISMTDCFKSLQEKGRRVKTIIYPNSGQGFEVPLHIKDRRISAMGHYRRHYKGTNKAVRIQNEHEILKFVKENMVQ